MTTPSAGGPPAGPVCERCAREIASNRLRNLWAADHFLEEPEDLAAAKGKCFQDGECADLTYSRLAARLVEVEREAMASRACIEFDTPSEPAQIIARLRLIVENHNKQCGDFVTQRNSAWRRAIELGKAKKAAEAALDRRGEEERAKALEAAARALDGMAGATWWFWGDAIAEAKSRIRSIAAAPSGDAGLTDAQIAEVRKEELERWRARYGDSEDALHKARMLLGWIVENEEIAFSDHYDATRDEWPLNDNRAALLREWDKKMAEAKAMAPSGDAKGTK